MAYDHLVPSWTVDAIGPEQHTFVTKHVHCQAVLGGSNPADGLREVIAKKPW